MAKFTLFLIHGIGVHRDKSWATPAIEVLSQAWKQDCTLPTQLQDHIEVVPIFYDTVFESYLQEFSDISKAVFSDALKINQSEKQHIADKLTEAEQHERHFVLSYLLDVLLYKMSIVKEEVNSLVAKQLYERIAKGSTADEFGIVAHSLGTRVINDTLQNIITGRADQANFYAQGYRLKFLMQISDVTDLFGLPLHHDPFPPKNVYSRDAYDYLRTVTNRFDPIARIIPTRLTHWPEGRAHEQLLGRPIYKDLLLDHVHETNVHGLTHYMLHPQITRELFDLCGFGSCMTQDVSRIADFPAVGPHVNPGLRNALTELMSDAFQLANASWQTYINIVLRFGELTEQHGSHIQAECSV